MNDDSYNGGDTAATEGPSWFNDPSPADSDFHEAEEAARSAHEWMDPGTPMFVHHYTSVDTFYRMLGAEPNRLTLYASDADYMNDESELQLYPAALHEVFSERYKRTDSIYRVGHPRIHHWLSQRMYTTYALSFTQLDDDLSQWRLYGDDGAGVCITFRYDAVVSAASQQFGGLGDARACRYVKEADYATNPSALALFNALDDGIRRRSEESRRLDRFLDVALGHSIALEAPLFKIDDYKGEGEFRLVVRTMPRRRDVDNLETHLKTPAGSVIPFARRARPRGTEILPYVTVDLTDAIESVRLGPKLRQDFDRRRYGIRALLDGAPFSRLDILPSARPYRG